MNDMDKFNNVSKVLELYTGGPLGGKPFSAVAIANIAGVSLAKVVSVLENLVKAGVLVKGHDPGDEVVDRYRYVGLDDEPATTEDIDWVQPAVKTAPTPKARAYISLADRDDSYTLYVNQLAAELYVPQMFDRFSVGYRQKTGEIIVMVSSTGGYAPVVVPSEAEGKEATGYRINSKELIDGLKAKGVPMNVKIPVEFDSGLRWWIGNVADAVPMPKREKKE